MKFCPLCTRKLESRNLDDNERLACPDETCGFVFWDNPIPVVAALVKHQGQYVVARNQQWPEGIFSLITGFLERGETPEQGVVRETKEEFGLDAEVSHFLGLHYYKEHNQLIIAFELDARGELSTNHEIAETKRLSPGELAQYNFHPLYITEKIIEQWQPLHPELTTL